MTKAKVDVTCANCGKFLSPMWRKKCLHCGAPMSVARPGYEPAEEPIPTRPWWAHPVLAAGILCSLGVAWISARYFAGQAEGDPPSQAMAYGFAQAPFLVAGIPLLLIGSLATIRPWTRGRPWLPWAASAGVIVWFLVAMQGPAFLFAAPS